MRFRRDKIEMTDAQEHELEAEVRRLATEDGGEGVVPSATYFANLMVKTNETIERVTSGKALSISWLARVAVPGVVAILFFFIGLHYYRPEIGNGTTSVVEAVNTLPQSALDSLIVASLVQSGENGQLDEMNMFEVSTEQLAEYCVNSEDASSLLEKIPTEQLNTIASILETKATNL